MSFNYSEVSAVRYNDSTVYEITLEVDGILCEEPEKVDEKGNENPSVPKVFKIQITDDADKSLSFKKWIEKTVLGVRESRNKKTN